MSQLVGLAAYLLFIGNVDSFVMLLRICCVFFCSQLPSTGYVVLMASRPSTELTLFPLTTCGGEERARMSEMHTAHPLPMVIGPLSNTRDERCFFSVG